MSFSRWKMMAGVLGVSLGGLAAVSGQCPKPDANRSAGSSTEVAMRLDSPTIPPPPPVNSAPPPTVPTPPVPAVPPAAELPALPPPPTEPTTKPDKSPSTPATPPILPATGSMPPSLPPMPDLPKPTSPPVVELPSKPTPPSTPPAPPSGSLPPNDPVIKTVPTPPPPAGSTPLLPPPADTGTAAAPPALTFEKPATNPTPPQASVTPAAAVVPANKYRILLRVGEGEPTFEVRSGDDLLLKVACEKVDIKSPERGNGPSSVTARGRVRFVGFGAEGTCQELSFLSGTGEVSMTGAVRIQVKDKLGRVESELSTESMKYRIDPSVINGSLKP